MADAIAVSHEATGQALAESGAPWYLTGTPIRDVAEISRDEARARLDLAADDRVMLIFGGSQAVARFNAAVAVALSRLVDRCVVLHVAGEDGYAGALAARESLPAEARRRYRPYPFLRDEMLPALVAADLVVGRAGSSTLAEVTALGIPSVIVPYPHAAGHQLANARVLAEAGAARIVDDAAFDADALVATADLLAPEGDAERAAMAAAARGLGRPCAADAVAALVMAAAERRPFPPADEVERISRGAAA
jgi:UDP-N-acetylglucosamine--N-acetylmuramyl-(pentapeptide) pyrophosphoryl-undecaprenol N-acetylglucosamine transferase